MYNNLRCDLALNKDYEYKEIYNKYNIKVMEYKKKDYIHRILYYKNGIYNNKIKNILKKELKYYFNIFNIDKNKHIFIVGLGNDANTADSIGPKTIKYINVNSHLVNMGIDIKYVKVSALEPGILGNTGIDTKSIIESVNNKIKADLIILIDSFVCDDIKYLNKTIEINNEGIIPGSGVIRNDCELNEVSLNTKVLVIGVPTALEINKKNTTLIMSTSDIDNYVSSISKIIGDSINEVIYHL